MPFLFEDFRGGTGCFILKVISLIFPQLGRVLRNGIFYFSHNTFEILTVTTRHVVSMAARVFVVSVTDVAQGRRCKVIRAAAAILSAVVTICCLEIQLAFMKPLFVDLRWLEIIAFRHLSLLYHTSADTLLLLYG